MSEKLKGRSREAITQDRKDAIVALIRRWDRKCGRLSGPCLEEKVELCLGYKLTYPGMFKHGEIKRAFEEKKQELATGKPKKQRPPDEELMRQRIEHQQTRITELEGTVALYKELFVRHHYNARARAMTIAELEAPIPPMHSYDDGTVKPTAVKSRA